ncbi:hypothetical protein GGC65_003417 [Sphingopyxis sp. OAS728]|uniref:hypothetical protein n=1 Tax=Sphingopyxis sp. OAS728 TaxID=2663823 RepID=UPI00178A5712|nr:hypothetical protein [Sphingopyxis sp. OAS728]MBE1528961.1 hypothetical protein [Sphingopyxis sp. OAS728]
MFKRGAAAIAGVMLLAGVVYLGLLSKNDPEYVLWFGLAAALAAPLGLTLLGFSIRSSDSNLVKRLAKVTEIERMITEAEDHEEKIRLLQEERSKLVDIIKLESRRQAIADRQATLENDAVRILVELDNLDKEGAELEIAIGSSTVSSEVAQLRERIQAREQGDLILRFGDRTYRIDARIMRSLPFGAGNILQAYLNLARRLLN